MEQQTQKEKTKVSIGEQKTVTEQVQCEGPCFMRHKEEWGDYVMPRVRDGFENESKAQKSFISNENEKGKRRG